MLRYVVIRAFARRRGLRVSETASFLELYALCVTAPNSRVTRSLLQCPAFQTGFYFWVLDLFRPECALVLVGILVFILVFFQLPSTSEEMMYSGKVAAIPIASSNSIAPSLCRATQETRIVLGKG